MKKIIANKISWGATASLLLAVSQPAFGLTFGEATVRSALGERLVVEIPMNALPDTNRDCFSVSGDGYAPGLYRIERLATALVIRTSQPVREPLINFTLTASCAGESNLSRTYSLLIDPASRLSLSNRRISALATPIARPTQRTTNTPVANRSNRRPGVSQGEIYRVRNGDTLWDIAAALDSNRVNRWRLMDQIVAANPQAFVNGNPDRLVSGAELQLPDGSLTSIALTSNAPIPTENATPVTVDSFVTETSSNDTAQSTAATTTDSIGVTDAAAPDSTTLDADRTAALLSVMSKPELTDSAQPEVETTTTADSSSPFKQAESAVEPIPAAAPDSTTGTTTEFESTVASVDQPGWGAKIGAFIVGICVALAVWFAAQLMLGVAARRRRLEASRNLQPETRRVPAKTDSAPIPTAARRTSATFEAAASSQPQPTASTSQHDDQYGAVEFGASDKFAAIDFEFSPDESMDLDFEVGTTTETDIDMKALMDDETQQMLERDYEAELTRTQQIEREIAEQALRMQVTAQLPRGEVEPALDDTERTARLESSQSPTVPMPTIDEDTLDMPMSEYEITEDELDLADAAIAEFTASLDVSDDLEVVSESQRTAVLDQAVADEALDDVDHDTTAVMPQKTGNSRT